LSWQALYNPSATAKAPEPLGTSNHHKNLTQEHNLPCSVDTFFLFIQEQERRRGRRRTSGGRRLLEEPFKYGYSTAQWMQK
jgi:hypothetical protein